LEEAFRVYNNPIFCVRRDDHTLLTTRSGCYWTLALIYLRTKNYYGAVVSVTGRALVCNKISLRNRQRWPP